jgi:hypothetical protein
LRVTQIAVVATYFLAAWAKLRYGGPGWLTGSVLARAILRRGTDFADLIAPTPGALIAAQIGIVTFGAAQPAGVRAAGRWRYLTVAFFYSFHWMTIAMITISFAPHQVALLSFLPLERVRPVEWYAAGRAGYARRPASRQSRSTRLPPAERRAATGTHPHGCGLPSSRSFSTVARGPDGPHVMAIFTSRPMPSNVTRATGAGPRSTSGAVPWAGLQYTR